MDFSPYAAVLLDLDGTVYHEDHALPGAAALIARLRREGRKFACLSNSTLSPKRVRLRLSHMGIELPEYNIYTAGAAAADYVRQLAGGNRDFDVFNLATESLQEMLEDQVRWVEYSPLPGGKIDERALGRCDVVVAGIPTDYFATEERQRIALGLLRGGAALLGMCADRVFPSPRGIEFGSGALTSMLAYAANVKPVFTGKPEKVFFHELCRRLDVAPEKCLLIGDNLESDIGGGKGVGMRTILTLTGVTRREDAGKAPAPLRPDDIIESLEAV